MGNAYVDRFASPTRDQVAARVTQLPGTGNGDDSLDGVVTRKPEPSAKPAADPLACFSQHLQARMRLLGWDQGDLQEHAGIKTPQVAARAVNGTGVDLGLAAKLAVVGLDLPGMLGVYECGTCAGYGGKPPKGCACLECGQEGSRG